MNAVGIDVSKGKSMIAIMRPFGEVVASPYEVNHAVKIANYGLDRWLDLTEYIPEEDIRQLLKTYNRQYAQYTKISTMLKNNLISLLDQAFPGVNTLFTSPPRKSDGHEKWFDFAKEFWHCQCVCGLSEKRFVERYLKWCRKSGYNFSQSKAEDIYIDSCGHVNTLPKNGCSQLLIIQAISQLSFRFC